MSEPRKTRAVLTRAGSGITYSAFRLLADVSLSPIVLPVPANVELSVQKITMNFSWDVSNTPTNFRLFLFDSEPSPPITLADNVDINTVPFVPQISRLNRVPDIQVFPTYGISVGVVYFPTSPLSLVSSTGGISAVFITTTGTTAPASGRVELGLYYDT